MTTSRNPTVIYIGKHDTANKIVINTNTPKQVITVIVGGTPALALSATEAQELLTLLSIRSFTIDTLAKEIRSYLYNSSIP
jgi:hypothetical protein